MTHWFHDTWAVGQHRKVKGVASQRDGAVWYHNSHLRAQVQNQG